MARRPAECDASLCRERHAGSRVGFAEPDDTRRESAEPNAPALSPGRVSLPTTGPSTDSDPGTCTWSHGNGWRAGKQLRKSNPRLHDDRTSRDSNTRCTRYPAEVWELRQPIFVAHDHASRLEPTGMARRSVKPPPDRAAVAPPRCAVSAAVRRVVSGGLWSHGGSRGLTPVGGSMP